MIEKDIIKDQKETIHRLQEECKEKTETIEEMNKVIQDCNAQRTRLYKALEEIREIANVNTITTCWSVLNFCDECKEDCEDQSPFIKLKEIVDKINEVLNKGAEDERLNP